MSSQYRCNQLLEIVQAYHRNPAPIKQIQIKVHTEGCDTNWLSLSDDELRDIAEILYKSDNARPRA
jgi:hypothetical protein